MDVRSQRPVPHVEFLAPSQASRGRRWWEALVGERRELVRYWPVVLNMVRQELRVRYQRSFLGFLWTLVNPVLMMATMTVVFTQMFSIKNYSVYLFAGLVPWNFLAASLNDCAYCLIANEGLIRKVYLPKLVFPLARLLINLTTFCLSLAALFLLLKPLGARFSPPLVLLPVVIALFAMFVLGLGLMVSVGNTFYRDCSHLIGVVLQAWYFATPVFYEVSLFKPESRWMFRMNPAYPFIQLFQTIIRDGAWPARAVLLTATGLALASLGVGYAVFKSHEHKLVFRL